MKQHLTAFLLFIAALFVGAGTALVGWTGDDAVYCFIVGDDPDWNERPADIQPVRDLADVLTSQLNHYVHANGRMPVHIVVQAFAGPLGRNIFAVANGLMFGLVLWLTARFAIPDRRRRGPLLYLLCLVAMLYLFPAVFGSVMALWTHLALSVNYLWVMALMLVFLLLLRRSPSRRTPLALGIAVGLLTGWSNEAFAVPLAATTGIFWLARRCRFRSRTGAALCISLWIGTLPLIFSPGTLARAAGADGVASVTEFITRAYECYSELRIVYVLAIALVAGLVLRRRATLAFVRANRFLCLMLAIDVAFTAYAHSYAHSMCLLEFLSLVLLIRAADTLRPGFAARALVPTAVATAVLAALMVWATYGSVRENREFRAASARLASAPDGITYITPLSHSPLVRPLVALNITSLTPDNYSAPSHMLLHARRRDVLPLILPPYDYRAVRAAAHSQTLQPGHISVLNGDEFYIITDTHLPDGAALQFSYACHDLASRSLPKRLLYTIRGNGPYTRTLTATRISPTILLIKKPNNDPILRITPPRQQP